MMKNKNSTCMGENKKFKMALHFYAKCGKICVSVGGARNMREKRAIKCEEVVNKLTGNFEVDRKLLLDAINSIRKNNGDTKECQVLGVALYRELLDNGLNESDVINVDRLLDKVDAFMDNNQPDVALDILEVIDAVEPFQKFDEKKNKLYCFENEIELRVFHADGILTRDIVWIKSNRPNFLARKAKILLEIGKTKEALGVIEELLEINPVSFNGHILKAQCYRAKNPKKFRQSLDTAYKYAFSPKHFATMFVNYYNYYADKESWLVAYAVLNAIKIYDMSDALMDDIEALEDKMTRTVVTPFKLPTPEQILDILDKEGVEVYITEKNLNILIDVYEDLYKNRTDNRMLGEVAEMIRGFGGEEQLLAIIQRRLQNRTE